MRYEKGRKDTSRRRIMEVAAERFKGDGIAASGLAGIMSEAGLTNGAFYPHFHSKSELVRESVVAALEDQTNLPCGRSLPLAASNSSSRLICRRSTGTTRPKAVHAQRCCRRSRVSRPKRASLLLNGYCMQCIRFRRLCRARPPIRRARQSPSKPFSSEPSSSRVPCKGLLCRTAS